MKKALIFNRLHLKIIGLATMTFSHIAIFLFEFNLSSPLLGLLYALGAIALPIFLYLLIESLDKTKHLKNYLLSLGISALIIYIVIALINYFVKPLYFGNIFMDLFLLAIGYYLIFVSKNKYLRLLLLIPLSLFILSFLIRGSYLELPPVVNILIDGLMPQYHILSLGIFTLFELVFYFYKRSLKKALNSKDLINVYTDSFDYQLTKNGIYALVITFFALIPYLFISLNVNLGYDLVNSTYMLIALIPLILYNGTKGFSNKIIKYAFYFYYPLHLVIIYLVVSLL